MIKIFDDKVFLLNGEKIVPRKEFIESSAASGKPVDEKAAKEGTISYGILSAHNMSDNDENLKIKFDAITSHDITYVAIVQTAKASGMEKFPVPYVLTNCHNSLCAVGGTINEDDHIFGLSAAKKYGGIYVPPHIAVIHQYMREMHAGCGSMILGSDSHTRYGALGTMAIGEGGGELVKQLLCDSYDVKYPDIVGVYLDNAPMPGVGPHDISLAIIGEVFKNGYVKNKVMEFVGPGISSMDTDFRNSIDVMTTETTCLSSVWCTDEDTKKYLNIHGRADAYKELKPKDVALYDGMIYVDLAAIRPMIALPFHPSNTYTIDELNSNLFDILATVEKEAKTFANDDNLNFCLTDKIVSGKLQVQQGIIAGCAGGNFGNMANAAEILKAADCGNDIFQLAVYPSSQPVFSHLVRDGSISKFIESGATIKTAFCGPCFGAGDTPANNTLSIRHTTRNFPSREGSKPGNGQMAAVALMDARSIAATAANGGILTAAPQIDYKISDYSFDDSIYKKRVYQGFGKPCKDSELTYGPNIKDWPEISPLSSNILLKVSTKIMDEVTTTDELIPSGETSSYRSNPLGLAEFTLSRRDPLYVGRAKAINAIEIARKSGGEAFKEDPKLEWVYNQIKSIGGYESITLADIQIGSVLSAMKPGDGSAREQAASCQRVLGGLANITKEYATKRYRSNVINWGMIPFQINGDIDFEVDDYIFVPNILEHLNGDMSNIKGYVIGEKTREINLYITDMTNEEKAIIKAGCLINYNRTR